MRFIPTPSGMLAPYDQAARNFLLARRNAEPVEVEMLHSSDEIFRRKIFASIHDVAKALDKDPERLRAELLYKTGNFQNLGEIYGTLLIAINSMSRRHMSEQKLREFWDEALEIIEEELLPQVTDAAERDRLAATLLPVDTVGTIGR